MELDILSLENGKVGKISLPKQFNEDIRPDLIKRAVLSISSQKGSLMELASLQGKERLQKFPEGEESIEALMV